MDWTVDLQFVRANADAKKGGASSCPVKSDYQLPPYRPFQRPPG